MTEYEPDLDGYEPDLDDIYADEAVYDPRVDQLVDNQNQQTAEVNLESQFEAIERDLGRRLTQDEAAALAAVAFEVPPDEDGMPSVLNAYEHLPEGPDGHGWEVEDGNEDLVEGQIQALEELTGKRLGEQEGDELATRARERLDLDGDPDVAATWHELHGDVKHPNTQNGRRQRLANEMESAKREEEELEKELGGVPGEDPDAIKSMPKFDNQRERREWLAKQVEEASEAEAVDRDLEQELEDEHYREYEERKAAEEAA